MAAAVPAGWSSRPATSRAVNPAYAGARPAAGVSQGFAVSASADPAAATPAFGSSPSGSGWDTDPGLSAAFDAAAGLSAASDAILTEHARMLGAAPLDAHLGGVNPAMAWQAAGGGILSATVNQQGYDAARRAYNNAWNAALAEYRRKRAAYEARVNARRTLINNWYDRQQRFSRLWGCGTQNSCNRQLQELIEEHDVLMLTREGWRVIADYRRENVTLARAGFNTASLIDWTDGVTGMDVSRWLTPEQIEANAASHNYPNPFCSVSTVSSMPSAGPNHADPVTYSSAARAAPTGWFSGNEARIDAPADTNTHWPTLPGQPLVPYVLDVSRDQVAPLWHGGTDGIAGGAEAERARRHRTLRSPPEVPVVYEPGSGGSWNPAPGDGMASPIPNSWSYMPKATEIRLPVGGSGAGAGVLMHTVRDLQCEPHLSIAGCASHDHGARWLVSWISWCSGESRCSATAAELAAVRTLINTAPQGATDADKREFRRQLVGRVQQAMSPIVSGVYAQHGRNFSSLPDQGDPADTDPGRRRQWVELACPTTEEKHNYGAVYPEVYDPGDSAPCNVPGSATAPCDADDVNDQVRIGLYLDDHQTGCPVAGEAGCAWRIKSRWNDRLGGTGYGGGWERGMYSCEPERTAGGDPILDGSGRPKCRLDADGNPELNTGSRQVSGQYPRARFYEVKDGPQAGKQVWFNGGFAPIHRYRTRTGGQLIPSGSTPAAPGRVRPETDAVFAGGESVREVVGRDYFTDERPDTIIDYGHVMRSTLYEVLQRDMAYTWNPALSSVGGQTQQVGGTSRGMMFGWPSFDIHTSAALDFMRLQETQQLWGKPPGECTGHHDCSVAPGQMDMAWVRTEGPIYWFGAMRPGVDASNSDTVGGCMLVPMNTGRAREAMAPVLSNAETWCVVPHDRVPEGTCPTVLD